MIVSLSILAALLFVALILVVVNGWDRQAKFEFECGEKLDQLQHEHDLELKKLEDAHDMALKKLVKECEPLKRLDLENFDLEEFRAAFDVDDDNALWQAVHQLLDGAIVKGVEGVEPPPSAAFTAESRTHAAGELSSLRELQKDLLRWQREARRAKATAGAESDD